MERIQVVRDLEEGGILGVLTAKDRLILLSVAELAAPGENREFSKTPVSIAKRTRAFSSGAMTPESISFALLRMAACGTIGSCRQARICWLAVLPTTAGSSR